MFDGLINMHMHKCINTIIWGQVMKRVNLFFQEQFISGNLTSLNSIPSNSPVHENNTFNNINLYASCTDELNYNAKNVSYKPKVNNNLVNSQGQTYNNNFINNDEQTNSNNNELELNKESYNPNDEKRRKISTADMSMFAANKRVEGKKIEATERVQLPQSNLYQTATQSQQPEKVNKHKTVKLGRPRSVVETSD